jgi:hypothetical protein
VLCSFGFLQQSADAIVRAPGDRRTQMHRFYSERSDGLRSSPPGEACPQILVDDGFEGPTRTPGLGLKPHGNVFVQSQGGSHSIKMLSNEHHDVYSCDGLFMDPRLERGSAADPGVRPRYRGPMSSKI